MAFTNTISTALFANSDTMTSSENLKKLRNRVAEKSVAWQNDEQPLAQAQRMADIMMAQKQRRPMVFEFRNTKDSWGIVTLYINPERLSIQTQKIKSKQVTRGGIYYHHYGDDHWQLSLSGTTGLSGMKGIEALEKAYHASGTLLKYKTFGPQKTDIVAGEYGIIDYKDTVGVLDSFTSIQNPTVLGKIQNKYKEENQSLTKPGDNALAKYALAIMETHKNNVQGLKVLAIFDRVKTKVTIWETEFKNKNGRLPTAPEYYSNMVAIFQQTVSEENKSNSNNSSKIVHVTADLIVSLCYYETVSKYQYGTSLSGSNSRTLTTDDLMKLNYSFIQSGFQNKGIDQDKFQKAIEEELAPQELSWETQVNTLATIMEESVNNNPVLLAAMELQKDRVEAMRNHLIEIADWEQRERRIQGELKSKALETMSDLFDDEWAPRRLLLYYENRVYIGHFDSFQYQRVANSPLIQYDLRFTVEKQIIGTLY